MCNRSVFGCVLALLLVFAVLAPSTTLAKGKSSSGSVRAKGHTKGNVNSHTGKAGTKATRHSGSGYTHVPNADEPNAGKPEADKEPKAEAKRQDEKEHQEATAAAEWRTWTSADSTRGTEAKFGGVTSGKVTLKKRNGSTVQVPLEKLSDEDREWITDHQKSPTPK